MSCLYKRWRLRLHTRSRCASFLPHTRDEWLTALTQLTLAKWGGYQKPFWECPDEIDVGLVADALATIYRFLSEEESIPIIRQALQPEMSDAVKISAIKACITLITEVGCCMHFCLS